MVSLSNVHTDVVHDAELDYYGRRLATCSSDRTIKIFEVDEENSSHRLVDTLRGHEGPVWQVAWGHPKYGGGSGSGLLASCAYDGKVCVWREQPGGTWRQLGVYAEHQASVNSIAWAPVEYGPLLLCGSSDGRVSVVEVKLDAAAATVTALTVINAHQIGTNSVSWAPVEDGGDARRFVSGGGDNLAKIWKFNGTTYELEATLEGHTDWVRDVSWSPSMLSKSYIASGSQDKQVFIWTKDPGSTKWERQPLRAEKFPDVVWRLSWSLSGNILAVSGGDSKVTLWKEVEDGKWETAGEMEE